MARPNYFQAFDLVATRKIEEAAKKGVSEEELALSELGHSAGWKVLAESIEAMRKELDQATLLAMQSGQNFEEIGRTAVAVSLTKEMITRLENKVTDAKESVKRNTD